MRKSRRQKLSGTEWEAVSWWRKFYGYLARPGVRHSIKKGLSRKFRRQDKQEIRKELQDE